MSQQFHRDYLLRLPLPLAQLYSRAYNAKDARARHDNAFYLCEALVKLSAAPAIACYLQEVEAGRPRLAALDGLLAQLALPSLGQWLAMLRELSRQFGSRTDAATHPLGRLWTQLTTPQRHLAGVLALYRRIKNGPDGQPAGDQSCTLLELFDALVQYRNGVFGHGAARFDSFYDQQMGPLLMPALNDLLAPEVLDWLGPPGSRLVYVSEVRTVAEGLWQIELRELVGLESLRLEPQEIAAAPGALLPSKVAVIWPGRPVPLRLDPLLQFRETDLNEELLFLNRDRNGKQVEYLSYTTGRTERDRSMVAALTSLLARVTSHPVRESDLERLAAASLAETPPSETVPAAAQRPEGDFELLAEIGRGGMGVVYLARQLSLGQLVALKTLPAELAGDDIALARFKREIRHLARCEHPNIIKVLSSGVLPDGQMYYTMEYVPGSDLEMIWRESAGPHRHGTAQSLSDLTWTRAVLSASQKRRDKAERSLSSASPSSTKAANRGAPSVPLAASAKLPLPPLPASAAGDDHPGGYVRQVVTVMRDAALALQAVHEQGIVHRDVKPGNLVLTPDGSRVVLMDFGLAKGQSITASISRSGGLLGTLRYAAPEQLAAATLEVKSTADIRGLGATMWELLTRERLFGDADDEARLAYRIHEEDVPALRSVDPSLDRDLEAIVARATERRVADRIQSAALLAEYLQLYLDGKSLPIRPAGVVERSLRWARKQKEWVAALLFVVIALLAGGVWSYVRARQQTAQELVQTLVTADIDNVQQAVNELQSAWSWVAPLLRDQIGSAADGSKQKLNLSLALLPHDPSQSDYLYNQMLKASPSELRVIRTALEPQAAQITAKLWSEIEGDDHDRFIRAACALADFDPQNPAWANIAPRLASELVSETVLLVGQWQQRLQPVKQILVPRLTAIFADPKSPSSQRELAVALLADYAKNDPDTLAQLIFTATPEQYNGLFHLLGPYRAQIVDRMTQKLAEVTHPNWMDLPLNSAWKTPDAALGNELDGAAGMLAERFAFCHALPLARFGPLAEALRASGYRPTCFRPYAAADKTLVAATWKRDGLEWQSVEDLSADELKLQDANWRQHGLLPHDIACYTSSGPGPAHEVRYAALWAQPEVHPEAQPESTIVEAQLDVGIAGDDAFMQLRAAREKTGLIPRTLTRLEQPSGPPLTSAVWHKLKPPIDRDSLVYGCRQSRAWYESKQTPSRVEMDVQLAVAAASQAGMAKSLVDPPSFIPGELQFAAVWWEWSERISEDVCGLPADQALARCRQLAAQGYRPVAISAVVPSAGGATATASVWHLPAVPDETTEALALEQAMAAATLLRLNQPDAVWPLFRHTSDPRLRTDLIHEFSPLEVPPSLLIDRLGVETDVSARRALILCLGVYSEKQFAADARQRLVDTLKSLYASDPDAGIHSAAEWVLRQRGFAADVPRVADDPPLRAPGSRGWYTTQHGFTMVLVPGPVEFWMGSPGTETDRFKQEETMHRERIARSLAVATKKVSVAQFKQFQPNFPFPAKYSATDDGPIVSVTWFDAVRYCQWLSEQEKIPPDQWCYPPLDQIKPGMQLPKDHLARAGYRLPTEAEWEYFCRAGAATSRCFGQSRTMLDNYGWSLRNAGPEDVIGRAWPLGLKKPNDFGLFDIHGNVWEWCGDRNLAYPEVQRGQAVDDIGGDDVLTIDDQSDADRRILRGASFVNPSQVLRCAARNRYRPSIANYYVGLRVVRTIAADAAASPAAK